MPSQRNANLKYDPMPLTELRGVVKLLYEWFMCFLYMKGFPHDTQCHVSAPALVDIIIRVDKRKAYYQCFHGMAINECKKAALYAYWILKLRPFTIIDTRFKNDLDACCINETFAVYLIGFILEIMGRIKQTKDVKESYSKFLEYAFRFRNFTIDSFVVLVESISTETLEKDYPNLSSRVTS
jgi:hypothetical protein